MKKVSVYRQHAAECRALAAQMTRPEQRDQLLEMAETWDLMAEQRERLAEQDVVWASEHEDPAASGDPTPRALGAPAAIGD